MPAYPLFLSVVCVVRNEAESLETLLRSAETHLTELASDYELIVVDNASEDDSLSILSKLTEIDGLPNLQVYALTKQADHDAATWVGVESALGDFVAVLALSEEDFAFLPQMLDRAVEGCDVVFARSQGRPASNLGYRLGLRVFNTAYRRMNGIDLTRDAPLCRVLSKRVVNYVLKHNHPAIAYRHLPATAGFNKAILEYDAGGSHRPPEKLRDAIDRGMRLLVSTTRLPMRLVTWLSLAGAMLNLIYSVYIVAIWLFKRDVEPGWVSLSLQQSGMFFLLSLVLLMIGEYTLQGAADPGGTLHHVGQEFTSSRMTRLEKLNVETGSANALLSHDSPGAKDDR